MGREWRKGRRRCAEVELNLVSSVHTSISHLNSGPSHSPLSETKFLTHFSLGFLLFMMKSLAKGTKIENKVHTKEQYKSLLLFRKRSVF